MKPSRGDIREDGMYYDGSQWRRKGVEHHMTDDGLVYCQGKFRTLESYIQRGGKPDKIKHYPSKISVINKVVTNLYNQQKSGYVYAIGNNAWEGWIKIGMAVDAEDRLKGYQTSSPHRDYFLLHKKFFHNIFIIKHEFISIYIYPFGLKIKQIPLLQYLFPVGLGPSSNI